MDFLDPKKQKAHAIRLGIGYAFVGLALVLATVILLYQSYGFGIDRNGKVIQNGLVFVSSQPSSADIYLNGQKYKNGTNTRMTIPAGQYVVQLSQKGYRTWQRAITVEGGVVERFDYPFLFPTKIVAQTTKQYDAAPLLSSQSTDLRWLLVSATAPDQFDLYDLNEAQPVAKTLVLPQEILTAGTTTTGWQTVQWAGDDRHALLRRIYQKGTDAGSEYILFDRQAPEQSQNLSELLGFTPTTIEMRGHNYDQYFAFDQNSGELFTASLKKPTPQAYIDKVLAFTTDGNTVLYATSQDAPAGKALVRLKDDDNLAYTVRQVSSGGAYLLDLARYSGKLYVAAGAQSDAKTYVYRDPFATLKAKASLVPVQILKLADMSYVAFSPNARFVIGESGPQFTVYDAETDKGYTYDTKVVLDTPQPHANWMDDYHLDYVSGGRITVFDYDGANTQMLSAASSSYVPYFAPNYRSYYALGGQNILSQTQLLAK